MFALGRLQVSTSQTATGDEQDGGGAEELPEVDEDEEGPSKEGDGRRLKAGGMMGGATEEKLEHPRCLAPP